MHTCHITIILQEDINFQEHTSEEKIGASLVKGEEKLTTPGKPSNMVAKAKLDILTVLDNDEQLAGSEGQAKKNLHTLCKVWKFAANRHKLLSDGDINGALEKVVRGGTKVHQLLCI